MKLRNKKTGQIGNFIINKDYFECVDLDYVPEYRNLTELNAEWEDYEEPKKFWYIGEAGDIHQSRSHFILEHENEGHREIGNYFDTREEAEKAVEKLKAWKRLKDKGFRFLGYYQRLNETELKGEIGYIIKDYKECKQDLDLLFGGEE